MIMQGQLERSAEDRRKEDLDVGHGSLGECKMMKQEIRVAEMTMSELNELNAEVSLLKELLWNSKDELEQKEGKIQCLQIDLENVRKLESQLASKDSLIDILRQELNNVKESECRVMELEAEVERGKLSECKMLESLKHQTKLLEEVKIELEEAKQNLVVARDVNESRDAENIVQNAEVGRLKNELELVKDKLKHATGAEETSKKAMDELAIALTEVKTEANLAKEMNESLALELEHVKEESEQLKMMVRSSEEKYQKLLEEAIKEAELYRNTSDRLRVEAEESLLAWNGKEMGFVTCIKTTEEEKAVVQHERAKLADALKTAETLTRSAREENFKLRDILKQAINEANAAKAAAGIARDENSLLKDSLSEKDEALVFLHKENERLQINEVSANENLKEFKQLLSSASIELNIGNKETTEKLKSPISDDEHNKENEDEEDEDEDDEEESGDKKTFSFDLHELKIKDDQDSAGGTTNQEDHEKTDTLKGSILDCDYSPKDDPHTPITVSDHQRGQSTPFVPDEGSPNAEDHDPYDPNCDRGNGRKNNKKLFRRVSDIIMRKKMIQ